MKKKTRVWCDTCQKWHEVEGWQQVWQLEDWGCCLDFNKKQEEGDQK